MVSFVNMAVSTTTPTPNYKTNLHISGIFGFFKSFFSNTDTCTFIYTNGELFLWKNIGQEQLIMFTPRHHCNDQTQLQG